MKYFVLFFLFITNIVMANELLIYSNKSEFFKLKDELSKLKSVVNISNVFTEKETLLLKNTNVNPFILKVNFKNETFISMLKSFNKRFTFKWEYNQKIKALQDTYLDDQWALNNKGVSLQEWLTDIDVLETRGVLGEDVNAKNLIELNTKIIVAVIDSGIDLNHPDLKDNIYFKDLECKSLEEYKKCLNENSDKNQCHEKFANIDHDNNGYPLDCHGWNFAGKINPITKIQGDQDVYDRLGHGTHVSGIIGAVKNDIGIKGVIENVKILPIQVNGSNREVDLAPNETTTDIFAKGLLYAIKSNAQIINMSFGWSLNEDSILMRQMIELAVSKDILIVAAAGNSHHSGVTFPCSYQDVICVGSHSVDGKLSAFSNFGTSVDIVAPGTKILSTYPMHIRPKGFTQGFGYEYLSGTSQAAPFVAGALAKLLNLGHTPHQARIKLLASTRGKNQKYIRHGNLDIYRAHKKEAKSFIYPINKQSLLINWKLNETRKFNLKLKNYGLNIDKVSLKISVRNNPTHESITLKKNSFIIESWKKDEIKTFELAFDSENDIESDIFFTLNIHSKDEDKNYIIWTQAIRIISPDFNERNSETLLVENATELKGSVFKPFEIFDNSTHSDFIAIKEINNKNYISLIKSFENSYKTFGPILLPIKDPIFLKFSKVDLNLDGNSEYVITLIDNDSKERVTKFFILDNLFKPIRYEISKDNIYDNKISVLPGSFLWLRHDSKMVPAWIGYGKSSGHEIQVDPWQDPPEQFSKFHFYLLNQDHLQTIELKNSDQQFVSFLYQSLEEKKNGNVKVIVSTGQGFYKSYEVYNYDNKLEKIHDLNLKKYHDLLGQRPLALNSNYSNAFFFTQSVEGSQNVTTIMVDNQNIYTEFIKIPSFSKLDPIIYVLKASDNEFIYQTKNHLVFYNRVTGQISKTESKVSAKTIRHVLLKYTDALYLNANLTPGLTSEVISSTAHSSEKIIYRSSLWRMLGVKGCESLGFTQEEEKDKLFFFCANDSKIIKICY